MKVFVTGATGFIGSAVTRELLAHGHQVLGLARSEAGAQALAAQGAAVHRGTLEDHPSLRAGAAGVDAVIHLGFIHDFSKFAENCETDRQAIGALGEALAGSHRPLLVTSGVAGLGGPGRPGTEADAAPTGFPRVSEPAALALLERGVDVVVLRLPQVHDPVKQGLVSYLAAIARATGVSVYVGDGSQGWAAAHVSDVARLYRLALERRRAGARYHAVAEEAVPLKAIATALSQGLKVPLKSILPAEAEAHFGWVARFAVAGGAASSAATRRELGWEPTGPGLLADLAAMDYSAGA